MEAFEEILEQIPEDKTNILDIGSGGFVGTKTTDFLYRRKYDNIVLVESNLERFRNIRNKYKNAILINEDFFDSRFLNNTKIKFDIICVDLDYNIEKNRMNEIIDICKKVSSENSYLILFWDNDDNWVNQIFNYLDDYEFISKKIRSNTIVWILLKKK